MQKGSCGTRMRHLALPLVLSLMAGSVATGKVKQTISTTFVEVLVEGVPIGSRYVLTEREVDLTNKSDFTINIRYDAERPGASLMRAGYDPIPDVAWISFEPRQFKVKSGETVRGKLVLYIPDDQKLVGKRYQAMLNLHADPARGSILAVGLKPRLLFSVGGKDDDKAGPRVVERPRKLAEATPHLLSGKDGEIVVPCGMLTVFNQFEDRMVYEVIPDADSVGRLNLRNNEAVLPDHSWIEIRPNIVVLPSDTRKVEVSVTARLPIAKEHFGKTYVAALRTVAKREGQKPVEMFNKVRVVVPRLDSEEKGKE